jgi:hypothetical protein
MDELKLLFLVALMGLGVYGVYRMIDTNRPAYRRPPPTPTITFVPPGTPGAKTFKQLQEERWRR